MLGAVINGYEEQSEYKKSAFHAKTYLHVEVRKEKCLHRENLRCEKLTRNTAATANSRACFAFTGSTMNAAGMSAGPHVVLKFESFKKFQQTFAIFQHPPPTPVLCSHFGLIQIRLTSNIGWKERKVTDKQSQCTQFTHVERRTH